MRVPSGHLLILIVAGLVLAAPPPASARVWSVSADSTGDFLTIGDAIRSAMNGDEIDIGPGYYNEALDTQGKGITLAGQGGSGSVVVNANGTGSALKIPFTPLPIAVRGMTLSGGNGTIITARGGGGGRYGGGIYIEDAAPVIQNCRIMNNDANNGGGIYVMAGSPRIEHCEIRGNSAGYGAGIAVEEDGGVVVSDCEISGNVGVFGGGIDAFDSIVDIERCRIHDNQAIEGSAIRILEYGRMPLRIAESVITRNTCTDGPAILARRASTIWDHLTIADNISFPTSGIVEVDQGAVTISNTIIAYGGTTLRCDGSGYLTLDCVVLWSPGSFVSNCQEARQAWSGDPLFCDHVAGNYTLRDDSPCLPGHGPPGCGLIGALNAGCGSAGVDQDPSARKQVVRWGALKGLYR